MLKVYPAWVKCAVELEKTHEGIKQLERRQRQKIYDVEDEIEARRDELIEALERQMFKRSISPSAPSGTLVPRLKAGRSAVS